MTRFVRDLDAGARVLVGTCDDLAIPRPLGPIRDLAGAVSPAFGAIEIARNLGAEPLTRRVATPLRELGLRVPQGPRETSTRLRAA